MESAGRDRVYAVLGAGRQGAAAAYDLGRFGAAAQVRLADRDRALAERAAARVNRLLQAAGAPAVVEPAGVDAADPLAVRALFEGAHAALSALPYPLNPALAARAIEARCSFCDLGGNTEISARVLALDAQARRAGVTLTPDCGLAPGLANTLAAYLIARTPAPRAVRVRCGGLPQRPRPPLDYLLTFAVEGLTNEYTGECLVLRQGRLTSVPALAPEEDEQLEFEALGRLEAFATSGGASTMPRTYQGVLEEFDYKTLRYPGHAAKLRLLRDLGLLSEQPRSVQTADGGHALVAPRALLHVLLQERLDLPEEPDLVVLRVSCEGSDGDRPVRRTLEILDRADPLTGFRAMERMTAFPAAIICAHLASAEAPRGAQPLERVIDPALFLERFRQRGLVLTETLRRPLAT